MRGYLSFKSSIVLRCLAVFLLLAGSWVSATDNIELSASERQWLKQHPVIRIGVDRAYKPVEYIENDVHKGLSADYLDLLSKKLGIRFETVSHPQWKSTLHALQHKDIDALSAVYRTRSRDDYMAFSDSFVSLDTAIITSTHSNNRLELSDLSHRRVAVVSGYFWEDILRAEHPDIVIVNVPNLATGLQEVAFGTVDALFSSLAAATQYIEENRISNLRVAGITPYKSTYHIGVRNDWPELAGILNKALRSITVDERRAIESRWFKLNRLAELRDSPAYVWLLVSIVLTVFGMFVIGSVWNYQLRLKVKQRTQELKQELNQRKITEQALQLAKQELERKVEERTQRLSDTVDNLIQSQEALEKANRQLHDIANRDGLTRIANRRSLDAAFDKALENTRNNQIPLTFILVDIDFFKRYNDHYGHQEGDRCLQQIAKTLAQRAKRQGEVAARYGGEEFALLLPGVSADEAQLLAQQVLSDITRLSIPHAMSEAGDVVSASLGVASVIPSEQTDVKNIVQWADQALYASKNNGRNQAQFHAPNSPQLKIV